MWHHNLPYLCLAGCHHLAWTGLSEALNENEQELIEHWVHSLQGDTITAVCCETVTPRQCVATIAPRGAAISHQHLTFTRHCAGLPGSPSAISDLSNPAGCAAYTLVLCCSCKRTMCNGLLSGVLVLTCTFRPSSRWTLKGLMTFTELSCSTTTSAAVPY